MNVETEKIGEGDFKKCLLFLNSLIFEMIL